MRLVVPDVIGLELWDVVVGGRPLQAWRDEPEFSERLADAVVDVVRLGGTRRSQRARTAIARVQQVHLLGGGVTPQIRDRLVDSGFEATVDADPVFAAARAAHAMLEPQIGAGARVGADIGQTSIKVFDGRQTSRVDRGPAAPLRDAVPVEARATARERTISFLGETLRREPPPQSMVLGVPCRLSPTGSPLGCSYCWSDPDPNWTSDLGAHLGVEPERIHLLNDAELAAVATAADERLDRARPVLTLTIGFGVGAALLVPFQ